MNTTKIIAIALLCTGTASLLYGGITHTSKTQAANSEPLQIMIMQDQKINMPITLGIGCLLFGCLLFTVRNKL